MSVPKEWKDGKAGGTPLSAAALIDLEERQKADTVARVDGVKEEVTAAKAASQPADADLTTAASPPTGKPGAYRLVPGASGLVWVDGAGDIPLKAYGAKWDGVTNDAAALEEAIAISVANNNWPIALPAGEGLIEGTPAIPKNLAKPLVIRGAGERLTTIKLGNSLQFLKWATTAVGDTVGNLRLTDLTVDGGNKQVTEKVSTPVVIGANSNTQEQVNIKNVTLERIRVVNVPTLEEQANARRCVTLQVYHKEPGLPKNVIDNINIRQCNFEGSQYGVFIAGVKAGSPLPINVYIGKVRVEDVRYVGPQVAGSFGYTSGVQIGQFAWSDGKDIVVARCYSENAADVGFEFDVPLTAYALEAVNPYNSGVLLNTFNPTTSAEPIVAKLTAKAEAAATKLEISSTANFAVGEQVTIYGATASTSDTRTITAIGVGFIEVSGGLSREYASGTWLSQVDVIGGKMRINDLKVTHTSSTGSSTGGKRGLALQNVENVIPAPDMEVDGYTYRRSWQGAPPFQGEAIFAQYGTSTSKTGNPRGIRVKNFLIDIPKHEWSGAGSKECNPIRLQPLQGATIPVELQGEVNISGPGATGGGTMLTTAVRVGGFAMVDIDVIGRVAVTNTGAQPVRFVTLSEALVGDTSGRVRIRTRPSGITTGGGVLTGLRLGKGCGFASAANRTKNTAIIAAGATNFEVESAANIAAGMGLVLDAESTAKCEVVFVEKVEGNKIFLVQSGETPGAVTEHAAGVAIARLNHVVYADSDCSGLSLEGVIAGFEDTKVGARLLTKNIVLPKPITNVAQTVLASAKIQQVLQSGQSGTLIIKEGTVSKVEYASTGQTFFQVGAGTNMAIHVNPGDFYRITYTVAPTVNFIPDRA